MKQLTQRQYRLLEGPIFHGQGQYISCVDIEGRKILTMELNTGKWRHYPLGGRPGFIVSMDEEHLLVGLEHTLIELELATGRVEPVSESIENDLNTRINDGKKGPDGRIYFGTMDLNESGPIGGFYSANLGADEEKIQAIFKDIHISNGLAFDLNKNVFYYIDTPTHKIRAYDYNEASGIGPLVDEIDMTEMDGSPDGMTIDSKGNLYVAMWAGGCVLKLNPSNGEIIHRYEMPCSNITCPILDEDEKGMYVTTAKKSDEEASGHLYYIPF